MGKKVFSGWKLALSNGEISLHVSVSMEIGGITFGVALISQMLVQFETQIKPQEILFKALNGD